MAVAGSKNFSSMRRSKLAFASVSRCALANIVQPLDPRLWMDRVVT